MPFFLGRNGQREDDDALIEQLLDFRGRCLAANGPLGRFLAMNFPCLFGEARADILGVRQDVIDERHHLARIHRSYGNFPCRGGGYSGSRLGLRFANLRRQQLADLRGSASRALKHPGATLRLEVLPRCKPTFETVILGALQFKNDHMELFARSAGQVNKDINVDGEFSAYKLFRLFSSELAWYHQTMAEDFASGGPFPDRPPEHRAEMKQSFVTQGLEQKE
jgi:hypothetical protein